MKRPRIAAGSRTSSSAEIVQTDDNFYVDWGFFGQLLLIVVELYRWASVATTSALPHRKLRPVKDFQDRNPP